MKSFATLFNRFCHRRIISCRGQELYVTLCNLEQCFFDTVGFDNLAMVNCRAKRSLVVINRGLKISDSDRNVVNFGKQHMCILPENSASVTLEGRNLVFADAVALLCIIDSEARRWGEAKHTSLTFDLISVNCPRRLTSFVKGVHLAEERLDAPLID